MTRRKILLLVYPTFSEFEISVASQILSKVFDIVTVSPNAGTVTGEAGWPITPQLTVNDVQVDQYEGILIPGAEDMIHIKDEEKVFELVRTLSEYGKIVGSICGAGFILLKAGILDGRQYTVTFTKAQREFLGFPENGYVWEPVVESDNIITAQGHAFVEFGLRLGEKLGALSNPASARDFYMGAHDRLSLA